MKGTRVKAVIASCAGFGRCHYGRTERICRFGFVCRNAGRRQLLRDGKCGGRRIGHATDLRVWRSERSRNDDYGGGFDPFVGLFSGMGDGSVFVDGTSNVLFNYPPGCPPAGMTGLGVLFVAGRMLGSKKQVADGFTEGGHNASV